MTFVKDYLFERAVLGADFLASMVQDDGKFIYGFESPNTRDEIDGFNILRHIGSTWAILCVNKYKRKDIYEEAATKAIDYVIRDHLIYFKQSARAIEEDGSVKLGANGLMVLALIEYISTVKDDPALLSTANKLIDFIKFCNDDNGKFSYHKMNFRYLVDEEFISEFYPGEATLALAEHFRNINNDSFAKSALHKTFHYYHRLSRYNGHIRDHWMLQAIEAYFKAIADDDYMFDEYLLAYARNILFKEIYDKKTKKSCPMACRTEGSLAFLNIVRMSELNNVYRDLSPYHDQGLEDDAASFVDDSIAHQLSLQVMDGPNKGGFMWSPKNDMLRCDVTQHNICSLLKYWKYVNGIGD